MQNALVLPKVNLQDKDMDQPMPQFPKPVKKPAVGSVGKSTSYKPAEGNVVESNVVDLLPAEVAFTEAAFGVRLMICLRFTRSMWRAHCLKALAVSSSTPKGLDRDKINIAAVDSACNRSCAGAVWIQNVLKPWNWPPTGFRAWWR